MSVRSWGVMWLILDSHPPSSPNIGAYWGKGSQNGWHGRKRSTKGGIFSSGDGRANGHVSVVVRFGLSKCYSPGGVCTGGQMEEEWTRDIASKEGNQEWVKGMMSGSGLEVGGFWRTYQSTPQKKKKISVWTLATSRRHQCHVTTVHSIGTIPSLLSNSSTVENQRQNPPPQ